MGSMGATVSAGLGQQSSGMHRRSGNGDATSLLAKQRVVALASGHLRFQLTQIAAELAPQLGSTPTRPAAQILLAVR
jgi:hypothetical protein